jgi:hypothetical protein
MGVTREFKYEGTDPRFENGKFYTYRQICDITGITYNTLKNRLYKDPVLTDKAIYEVGSKKRSVPKNVRRQQPFPRLETKADFISQEHLRKPLL